MVSSRHRDDLDDEGPSDVDLAEPGDEDGVDLVACPECGAEIYEDAERCPACGRYVVGRAEVARRRSSWWVVLALAIAALLVFLATC